MNRLVTLTLALCLALLGTAGMTTVGTAGALFVLPRLNGREPSLIWSIAGILFALLWCGLVLMLAEKPGHRSDLALFAMAISMCLQMVNVLVLPALQGATLLLSLLVVGTGGDGAAGALSPADQQRYPVDRDRAGAVAIILAL